MKIKTINIINGKILGGDSISFNTKSEYEDYINAMIDYLADQELDIEFNHEAFSTNETDVKENKISLFSSSRFKSIVTDNCIAWKEAGVITINILEDIPINIGSSTKTSEPQYLRDRNQEIKMMTESITPVKGKGNTTQY